MVPPNNLGHDLSGKAVNETQYRGMIGSLMYLTPSRPDIQFSTCLCARYQANPKESHLIAVKRIFSSIRYRSEALAKALFSFSSSTKTEVKMLVFSLFTLLVSYFVVKVKLLVRPSLVSVPQPKLR
ncbi:hypothetical protein Tco_0682607 [Tanacetum coccineum]|uniref:Retrovirus-related Pol polyprotein from transposon RE1 n=1 Tax=Tanacetum coccineum TaxID=301880 RepID=A0ABQ4XRP1_9ASTR